MCDVHAHTHTHTHTRTHTHTHKHTHMHARTHTHTHTHARMHTHTHAHMHTHTHTHTYTHTCTCAHTLAVSTHQYLQLWRLVTTFTFFGPIGFNFLFNIIFIYRYCRWLEEGSFRNKASDFVCMFLFGGVLMTVSTQCGYLGLGYSCYE